MTRAAMVKAEVLLDRLDLSPGVIDGKAGENAGKAIVTFQRSRAALALLKEESVQSYPSWIAELRGKSPAGIELRRYAYEHLKPGEALLLVREHAEPGEKHAVSYRHRDVHLGYVPRQHRWIADTIDDGFASSPSSKPSRRVGFSAGAQHSSARGLSFSTMAVSRCRDKPRGAHSCQTRWPFIAVGAE
jgi:hypothetical protein